MHTDAGGGVRCQRCSRNGAPGGLLRMRARVWKELGARAGHRVSDAEAARHKWLLRFVLNRGPHAAPGPRSLVAMMRDPQACALVTRPSFYPRLLAS